MIYLYAFLVSGIFCFIGQLIVSYTKLTSGHVTSLFAVVGSFLGFIGIYDKLINISGMGATAIITNFGASLYNSAYNGYLEKGILGIFTNFLDKSSLVIVSTVVFSFIILIFFKPKD